MIKIFLQLIFISFLFFPHQQNDQKEIQKESVEQNVKLHISSRKTTYSLKESIRVQYIVENVSNQPIYLIVEEKPVCGYNVEKREFQLMLEKVIYSYHLLEFPKLLKIKPKEQYIQYTEADCASHNVERSEKSKITGKFHLSVSVGYLDVDGMKKIKTLLQSIDPGAIARPFDETQKNKLSAPIEIEITE